jgi:hypothetical protein
VGDMNLKWFKHESTASTGPKLQKVLMKYGAQGYGLYWYCLELIAAPIDKNNITFELEHDCEILAYNLKIDSMLVEEIMTYMISLKLFELEESTNKITCLRLAKMLENSIVKNPQLKLVQEQLLSDNIQENPGQSGKSPARLEETRLEESKSISQLSKESQTKTPAIKNCPVEMIIKIYEDNRVLLKKHNVVSDKTKGHIRARWRKNEMYRNLKFWNDFFVSCESSLFLTGRVGISGNYTKPFVASLSWIMAPEKFDKFLNNEYS